ncbi:M23 family metallopeptidase [Paenibacillus sp. 1P07SE]|uniref:M23 family metallopeptidase n=1 Tax=Paenibacillus sp. 1P07SE TaxID=3132209 RepID=UPI0039A42542
MHSTKTLGSIANNIRFGYTLQHTKRLADYTEIRTSGFGMRWGRMHNGVDIAAAGDSTGANIVAFSTGYVEFSGEYGSYGYTVIIDHGNGVKTLYAHMLEHGRIRKGVQVRAGESIGLVGNTGNSTGPHLHFEIRMNGASVDPLPYLLPFNPIITGGSNL